MILPNQLGPLADRRGPQSPDETAAYLQRVAIDGGLVADAPRLINAVNQQKIPNTMGANKYDSASFVLTANGGYKAGKLYALKPSTGSVDPPFTRNSAAWRRNSAGVIVQEAVDVPLIYYPQGGGQPSFRFEPSSINQIRNPVMAGASAGSPGVMPTNWQESNGGLSRQVVAVGNENGIDFIDLRYTGTATGSNVYVYLDVPGGSVTPGTPCAQAVYMRRTGTALPNSFGLGIEERNAGNAYLTEGFSLVTLSDQFLRVFGVRTAGNASVAFVRPYIRMFLTIGVSYDFTVRIGYPQLELFNYSTSFMRSNGASAFTRAVSQLPVNGLQSANVFAANEGCVLFGVARLVANAAGTAPLAFRRADNTEVIRLEANGIANTHRINLPTLGQASAYNAGQRIAVAWNGSNVRISQGGVLLSTFTGTLGAVDQLRYTGNGLVDLRELLGYSTAPTDAALNALTV